MPLTVLGKAHHTIAEVEDVLAKNDHLILMMYAAYAPHMMDVGTSDPSWVSDWSAFQARYGAAKDQAKKAIAAARTAGASPNVIPAEAAFQIVSKSVKQNPDRTTKGDLQDLSNRLMALGITPDYSNTPQPRWGSNLDSIVHDALRPFTLVNDAVEAAAKKAFDKLEDNPVDHPTHYPRTWLLAILGVIGGILGLRWAAHTVEKSKKYALPALQAAAVVQPELIPVALAADAFHKNLPSAETKTP